MKLSTKLLTLFTLSLFFSLSLQAQWTKTYGPSDTARGAVFFTSADTGYISGKFGYTLKTLNGGSSWSALTPGGFFVNTVLFTSDNVGYLAGYQRIKKTTNGGASWGNVSSGSNNSYYGLSFPSANIGYAVSFEGKIEKTIDGGNNWTNLSSFTVNLYAVFFINDLVGYIAGSGGLIKKTVNGGQNWITQSAGTTEALYGLYFTDATHGCAIGGGGTILKTSDGGVTWVMLAKVTSQDLKDIEFVDADTGYVVGNRGTVLKTIDAGATWRTQPTGLATNLYSVSFPDAHTGYIAGYDIISGVTSNGIVLKTTNGGGPTSTCSPVGIATQPIGVYRCIGTSATFCVGVFGGFQLSYRWYKNGVLIDSTISTFQGNDTCTIAALTGADNGSSIYCVVSSTCWDNSNSQTTSDTVSMSVGTLCTPASLVSNSLGTKIFLLGHDNIFPEFTINVATGTPPFIYRWYIDGALTKIDTSYLTTNTLVAQYPGFPGIYQISCTVTNCFACGSGSGGGSNSVTANGSADFLCSYLYGSYDPIDQSKTTCQTATFSVNVHVYSGGSTDPYSIIYYTWFKNGTYIPGANSSSYTTPPLTLADNGNTYYCEMRWCDNNSFFRSNPATLTIIQPAFIVQQPLSQTLIPGSAYTLSVLVTGNPPFSYYWYKNGVLSSSTVNTFSTSSSYTSPILTQADTGNYYYCVVENGSGCYTISTDSVHFTSCTTSGSISGTACDSLIINGQSYTIPGVYTQTLVNSNGCDSVLTITITPAPSVVNQPTNQVLTVGSTASFTTSVSGPSPYSYYWYSNGLLSSSTLNTSAVSSSFTTPSLSIADTGNVYYCVVSNGAGCNSVSSDTVHFTSCKIYHAISPTACFNYAVNGQTYTTSGIYTQNLLSSSGCDSILTLNLTLIPNLTNTITQNGNVLSSSAAGLSYLWLKCDTSGSVALPNDTNQFFTPNKNGNYAVVVYQGLCADTSACFSFTSVNVNEIVKENNISIYPNPVTNVLQITSTAVSFDEINLYNLIGARLEKKETHNKKQESIDMSNFPKGIYFVEIKTGNSVFRKKVIKE